MEPSKHVHLQRRELIEKYHRLYARSRSLEDGQMKDGTSKTSDGKKRVKHVDEGWCDVWLGIRFR